MAITKEEELIVRGCDPLKDIIIPDEELLKIVNYLSKLPFANKRYTIHKMNINNVLHDGKLFFNENFKLHKIPHITFHKLPIKLLEFYRIKNIHPYKLPLGYVGESIYDGVVEEYILKERKRILFKNLCLGKTLTELSSASYVHEITHTQIDSIKGGLKDYYNQEVFSIFLELIHADLVSTDDNILIVKEANRVFELSEIVRQQQEVSTGKLELSREEQIENSKYIQSDFIALHLFHLYHNSNSLIKKEMLMNIQRVFNGIITVEDYLELYEVTFNNSKKPSIIEKRFRSIV